MNRLLGRPLGILMATRASLHLGMTYQRTLSEAPPTLATPPPILSWTFKREGTWLAQKGTRRRDGPPIHRGAQAGHRGRVARRSRVAGPRELVHGERESFI